MGSGEAAVAWLQLLKNRFASAGDALIRCDPFIINGAAIELEVNPVRRRSVPS
jgi:hypothetical protein